MIGRDSRNDTSGCAEPRIYEGAAISMHGPRSRVKISRLWSKIVRVHSYMCSLSSGQYKCGKSCDSFRV